MVTILVLVLLAPLLLINLVFLAEALTGLPKGRAVVWRGTGGRTTVIVPAHDEEQVIGRTLAALTAALGRDFEVVLVADNCTDRTAAASRAFNVTVIERHDPELRGKGFALAHARDWLRSDPPACVMVLDADCHSDRESLAALAGACQQLDRPVQAINLLEPARSAGPLVQLSSFAFLIKNLVRQRGLQRLAGSVHLTGTGMCLPWALFDKADLATASIVEDVRLGIELGRSGAPPKLVQESIVWSPHAPAEATLTQRRRWEGGYMALARRTAPVLIIEGVRQRSLSTLLQGVDLLVPPLALVALINLGALILLSILALTAMTSWLPVMLLGAIGASALAVLLVAWWKVGRDYLSPATLVRLPLYALWKIPMYAGLARKGAPSDWRRTDRARIDDVEG